MVFKTNFSSILLSVSHSPTSISTDYLARVSRDRYIHLVQDDLAAYDEILDQSEPLISILYNLVS